jgi:putative hydrolase of the HAD superfamily
VDAAADAMIDAGLAMSKPDLVDKIFKIYWAEGIEDQNIFDKVLMKEFGKVDPRILAAGIIGYKRAKAGHMTLYPHVNMALTDLLKMGVRMGVVSDAPRLSVWMRIVGLGLHHYFEHVVTFDDTGEKKPSPKPFKKILELMEVEPACAIMVGDWAERDIKGAKALGMKTAWAKYGNEFDTPVSGADYELDDIYDIVGIIRRDNEKGN